MIRWLFAVGCLSGCARDVQLCDATALSARALEGIQACQARGLEWEQCPERPRILVQLEKDLEQCSR